MDNLQKSKILFKIFSDGMNNTNNSLEDTKDILAKTTHFIHMLTEWNWQDDSQGFRIVEWVRQTQFIPFIVQTLLFCRPRIDTYAELLKDKVAQLLCKLTY